MKKYLLRLMCFVILAAFLCGCGKESGNSEVQPTGDGNEAEAVGSQVKEGSGELPEGYVLSAHFEDAGGEAGMIRSCMAGDALYYYTNVYDPEEETHIQDIYIREKGQEPRHLLQFGDGKRLEGIAADEEGCLYFLWGENETEDGCETYTLEKRSGQQEEIYSVDATEGMEGAWIYDMAVAQDGKLYGLTLSGIVLWWDENGVFQGRFTLPVSGSTAIGTDRMCYGLADAGEAGIYAFWEGADQESKKSLRLYELDKLREMEEAELEKAEPLRVDYASAEGAANGDKYIFGGHSDGLYMAEQGRMWRIDMADGSLEAVIGWQDINIKAGYVQAVRRQEDGGYLLYVVDTLEQENYWLTLEPIPASQVPEQKELVLGVAGSLWLSDSLASGIDQVVLSYNRFHPECHITVKEYPEKAVSDFQLELLKGEGPDILLERESFFNMEELAGKGAVEDLTSYLMDGEGISAEDILPGILDLITKEGKIPRIPLSFAMDIMILPEDMRQEVLTPLEMVEYMMQGEDTRLDYLVMDLPFLLDILTGAEMDRYVDETGSRCSFAEEDFVRLLEAMDGMHDMQRIDSRGQRAEMFRSGQLRAVAEEMNCMEDYLCAREAFSGIGGIAGFPNSAGEVRYPAALYDWMGINGASEHKEEAWGFIEFCLNYASRSDNLTDRFVVLKDKFMQQTSFEGDGSREHFIERNDYNENWEEYQKLDPVTREETELLRGMTEHLYFYEDDNLLQIISEEAGAFFEGGITAQEAADRIQNRANLLLGE